MKNMKRLLAIALVLVMVLALLPATAMAAPAKDVTVIPTSEKVLAKDYKSETFIKGNSYQYSDTQLVHAIVFMEGEPAATAENTTRAATKAKLANQHKTLRSAMSAQKISYTVEFDYDTLLNGMQVLVAYGELDKIAAMSGVKSVHIANEYKLPDDEINMDSSNQMTGMTGLHDSEIIGSGSVIAILDTGLNYNHEAFQAYDWMLQDAVLDAENTDAETYVSQKVPYAYDYADDDNDVMDSDGHGTHVSGIAAGYAAEAVEGAVTFCGAAPDAQLLAMKVFSDTSDGTNSGIYFAALEDAYLLGADVINMSLGSPNGFTYDLELEEEGFGNIYKTLADEGIIVCASAGNENSQAKYASNWAGAGYVTSDYIDYGILGSPASYVGNVAVASAVNETYHAYVLQVVIDGTAKDIPYNDSTENGKVLELFGGREDLQYVVIPGIGAASDFTGIDCTGKVALIQRGEITFTEKILNAEAAGAIGVIMYNHTDEDLMGMSIEGTSVPAVFINLPDGEAMKTLAGTGSAKVFFPNSDLIFESASGWLMSDFSSWGCANDLELKPSITGIGTNVWSADASTNDGYVSYNGTSMSSPDVAGCYAALSSYFKQVFPDMSNAERAEFLEDLTQSTAYLLWEPYTDEDGNTDDYIQYSPRSQGSGLIANDFALATPAYIKDPIKSLYDHADGKFSFSFEVKNLSENDVTYLISPQVQCDYAVKENMGTDTDPDLHTYNTLTGEYLENYGNFIMNCPEQITVPAGGSYTVDVSFEMSDTLMATLDGYFPNGTYIEGYVLLANADSWSDTYQAYTEDYLHATFMGFYGDWTKAPILEQADWRDVVDADIWLQTTAADDDGNTYAELGYTYLDVIDQEINTDISFAHLLDENFNGAYAGDNPFYYNENEFNEDHIAVSNTDSDSKYMSLLYMSPSTLRNTRHMIMVISDAETGEIYTVDDTEYVPKTTYDEENGFWSNNSSFLFDGTKTYGLDEPENLPNGTKVSIDFYANLAYGEDALGAIEYADLMANAQKYLVWSYGATVDSQAPTFTDVTFADGVLSLKVTDNEYAAGVSVYDKDFNEIDGVKIEEDEAGATTEVSFEIGNDYPLVYLAAQDYATNEGVYMLAIDKTQLTLTFHVPEDLEVDGGDTVTGIIGDTVTLPTVKGLIPGYEFLCWASAEVVEANDETLSDFIGDEYYFDGDTYTLMADTDLYALFVKDDGFYDPSDELDLVVEAQDDWSGTYAINGYYWDTDEDYVLDADGATVNCNNDDIEVQYNALGYGYMFGAPETVQFDFALTDDGYSICSRSSGKYLALDAGNIAFVDELSDKALWDIDFEDTLAVNLITNVADPSIMLVFDNVDQSIKAAPAKIDDFDTPYNLYLFGLAKMYLYTTEPTPCAHEWVATTENYFFTYYTCSFCDKNKAEEKTSFDNTPADAFKDVPAKIWYRDAVNFAVSEGLFKGIEDDVFAPGYKMSRAMLVTVLYRLEGEPAVEYASVFTDVPDGKYYSKAVVWAANKDVGVVDGIGGGLFAPSNDVTREQIATILFRYATYKGYDVSAKGDLTTFPDSCSKFAINGMTWAVGTGIISGVKQANGTNTLSAKESGTRAQVATMLMRFCKLYPQSLKLYPIVDPANT